ncbi:hypothetical protein AMATHDRAFT_60165 [Amanita thiersii Skay4041]|uniref:Uncharacterized protein n=1 Tax=Amanita thiersii Skay4041 TaxID=703135 RepID=A0A2A9NTC6_9AGAR|nr:hypothetical protein AMATHDRAFT_60165 [Amanita thiersii Skay4041]
MRQKYEQVSARHDDYQQQLERANAKMKKLQAENDLLLDVIAAETSYVGSYPPYARPPTDQEGGQPPYPHQSLPPQQQQSILPPPGQPGGGYPVPTSYTRSRSSEVLAPIPSSNYGPPPSGSNPNYNLPPPLGPPGLPPLPQSPPQGSHSNHQRPHHSPHLVHVNGGSRNGYQTTHIRMIESHEREPVGPPLPPSSQAHHHHPPPEYDTNGRHS